MADSSLDDLDKLLATRSKTGEGAKDIGAGMTGTEHFANQFVFGLTPALQNARVAAEAERPQAKPGEAPVIGPFSTSEFGDLTPTGGVTGDQIKQELKTSAEQHPLAATVGKGAAELAHQAVMTPLMPFAAGGRVGSAIASGAATGGLEGALQGTGHAIGEGKPLDTDTMLGIAKDTLLGTGFGGLGGALGHGIARVAQPAMSRIGTLGKGIADDVTAAFGKGAPTLEKAGAKALPAEAAQVGGMLEKNPIQQAAGQKLAGEAEMLAQRSGQVPELAAEKGAQQAKIGAKQAAEQAQLASSAARAEPTISKNLSPKVLANAKIGRVADEARASVAAGLGADVGKDSPAAWTATRELLTNKLEAASGSEAARINGAIKRIDKMLGKAAPDAAKADALGRTVADTGKVADIVNQPLSTAATAAAAPAKKLGDMTMGDLASKFGTSAISALGAGLGHGSIEGAVLGGLAPAVAKMVYNASKVLGTKGAIQLYMQDPAKFMAQYGKAAISNRPLGLLSQQAVKRGAPLASQIPALQNFLPPD